MSALKESAKSAKTTGKLWIEEFCCVHVCVEGGESMVKFGRSCYQAKILAVGELTYSVAMQKVCNDLVAGCACRNLYVDQLCPIYSGSKSEMERREQEFVGDVIQREASKEAEKVCVCMLDCLFCQLYITTNL